MPHIHTQPGQHDLTVSAYIIRTDGENPRALVHMHRKLFKLLPVGGHVELHEDPWQAIAHEITEEAGYAFDQLKVLQPKVRLRSIGKVSQHPYPVSINTHSISEEHSHTDLQYAFITDGEPLSLPESGESADLRWLSKENIAALDSEMISDSTKDIYTFIFDEVLQNWEAVSVNDYTTGV